MREFKFRFWSEADKKYFTNISLQLATDLWIVIQDEDGFPKAAITDYDEEYVIEQYTGVKDENGKEIYEGDILFDDFNNEIGYVVWNEDDLRYEICFYDSEYVDVYEILDKNYANGLKIVGNLHDKENKK